MTLLTECNPCYMNIISINSINDTDLYNSYDDLIVIHSNPKENLFKI